MTLVKTAHENKMFRDQDSSQLKQKYWEELAQLSTLPKNPGALKSLDFKLYLIKFTFAARIIWNFHFLVSGWRNIFR